MTKLIQAIIATALVFGLLGCTSSSVVPMSSDVIRVSISGCDGKKAEQLAFQHAARETILRGFDSFVITSSSGSAVVVKMFKESEQLESGALSARAALGEDWASIVEKGLPKEKCPLLGTALVIGIVLNGAVRD